MKPRTQIKKRNKGSPETLPTGVPEVFTKLLENLMNVVGDVLHPTVYQRLLVQVGRRYGHYLQETANRAKPAEPEAIGEYVTSLLRREGWDVSQVKFKQETGEAGLTIHSCPFGTMGARDPNVCLIERGILQGLTSFMTPSTQIDLVRGSGNPPRDCELTVSSGQLRFSDVREVKSAEIPGTSQMEEILVNHGISGVVSKLTDREREVFTLIGNGLSDKEIAAALGLSVRTVQGHGARIRQKLGIRSRTQLLRLSILQKASPN